MRILLWLTVGFVISAAAGIYILPSYFFGWLALVFGILWIVSLFVKPKFIRVIGVILLGCSVGLLYIWHYNAKRIEPVKQYDGRRAFVQLEATDYSRITGIGRSVDCKMFFGEERCRVRIFYDEQKQLCPGDQIYGVFTFKMTTPQSDEPSEYYQGKGIFLLAYAEGSISVSPAARTPAKYFPVMLRKNITNLIDNTFSADTKGFARALLLGDSSLLTYEEDSAFKISGIRHVIAVSGLHISILFSLAYMLAQRRRVSTALIGIPVLVLFAAVAGFTPSINRACIMQVLMILALLLDEDYDPWTALAFSILVMMLFNPMIITSVSFQLSVGCMIGIFLFGERTAKFLLRKMGSPTGRSRKARLIRWLSYSVGVTFGAMTVTTPLTAWYFGMISLVGIVTNLLALWVVSFVFYGIMLACVLGWIWLPLGKFAAWFVAWPIRYVILIAKLLSKFPLAAVYTCSIYVVVWIAVCYVLFAVFLIEKTKRPVVMICCAAICLAAALIASYFPGRKDTFCVTVFDVGEGQSILFQSGGKNYLVDCGGDYPEATAEMVAQKLLSQGIFRLDGLIVTHYDEENAGAVSFLLSRVNTKALYLPDISDATGIKTLLVQKYEKKIRWVREDVNINDKESLLTLITAPVPIENEKESSLCVLYQSRNYDILITGNRGVRGERALIETHTLPQLELLVAGNNGEEDSTNLELLRATKPKMVVVSSSDRIDHPAEELIVRLKLFGCRVYMTKQSGTIEFTR